MLTGNQKEYTIEISWSVSDVLGVAKDKHPGLELSNDDCIAILNWIKHNHDAEYGVNWSFIDAAITIHIENNEKNKKIHMTLTEKIVRKMRVLITDIDHNISDKEDANDNISYFNHVLTPHITWIMNVLMQGNRPINLDSPENAELKEISSVYETLKSKIINLKIKYKL